jgi:hypothetical protein
LREAIVSDVRVDEVQEMKQDVDEDRHPVEDVQSWCVSAFAQRFVSLWCMQGLLSDRWLS